MRSGRLFAAGPRRNEADNCSSSAIPFLVNWSKWVVSQYYLAQGLTPPTAIAEVGEEEEDAAMQSADRKAGEPDQLLGVVFSIEEVREIREETLKIGGTHLTEVREAFEIRQRRLADIRLVDRAPSCGRFGVILRPTCSR